MGRAKRIDAVDLRVNGELVCSARRPRLGALDAPLRGVALSDSPVLIRASREEDRIHVAGRLHALGRRRALPMHECRSVAEARALVKSGAHGTWALFDVAAWSDGEQRNLARLIALFDQHRLHGNLAREELPRIVVIESSDSGGKLRPELEQRLAFFNIAIA